MSSMVLRRAGLALALAAFGLMLWRGSVAEEAAPENAGPERKTVATADLGGEERYLTFLSTDKPLYRPGETIFVRGVLLHHASRKPVETGAEANAVIEIKGPKGDVVASGSAASQDSVLGFQWDVPEEQPGGEYTIHVTYPWHGFTPAERKFDIRAYRAPRLKSQIEFLRDGYGAGDTVVATLHVERAEGGVPAGAPVTVIARVDGQEVFRGPAKVNDDGDANVRFELPAEIARGEGTLAMVIEDGGVVETASKTIPILLQTVDLTMYPEGSELVAGLPGRVYFEAFTPYGDPADLAGIVVDGAGNQVAEFRSEHEGRGRFTFTPEAGKKYELRITEPSGIKTTYPVPEAKESGAVISSVENVSPAGGEVKLSVGAAPAGQYTVTLRQREKEVAAKTLKLDSGEPQEIALAPGDADGVLIATVWNAEGRPLAERLVFRQPAKSVHVKLSADKEQYVPGGKAQITVETADADGKPTSAVVGVTVTDESVLEMLDKRDQPPRLPVMVLLENEVEDLADAHVYFDPENEQAPLAVDLLLGVQGWRRFAVVDLAKALEEHGDHARRALALRIVSERDEAKWRRFGGAPPPPAAAPAPLLAPQVEAAPAEAAAPPVEALALDDKQARANDFAVPAPDQNDGQAPLAEGPRAREEVAERLRADARSQGEAVGQLRQALKKHAELELADAIASGEQAEPLSDDFVMVRVYAHEVRPARQTGERRDFTETLFWHAGLRTDENGKATFGFGLNDSVTSFQVAADAFSAAGALGEGTLVIESVEPFYLEPKMPLEVTTGDHVRIPIGLVNATDAPLSNVQWRVAAHSAQGSDEHEGRLSIPAGERLRQMLAIRVGKFQGNADLTLSANAGPYADQVTRTLRVVPRGFPIEVGKGGMIGPGDTVLHAIEIPESVVPGTVKTRIVVYPTPLASMTEALERLIQEPYGCFEQTSSTVYPLVMAQQYFMSHQGVDASLIERSAGILETGYKRLLGFESPSGGFEWFGGDPGHDALTAYGLLEFSDMSEVRYVDPAMLKRTREWMLDQRDGKGGYERKTHTLHTWVTDPECANTYNTWALLEAGIDADLATEVQWVRDAGEKSQNTYAVALAANVLAKAGDEEGLNHLLDKLTGSQQEDGSLSGATQSVVGSGGEALTIETTALAATAWLSNSRYTENVERAIKYLAEVCKAGRFGSTQSTVLALRAIVAYDASRATPKAPGTLEVFVDDEPVGEPIPFAADTQGAIEQANIAELLSPGAHSLQISMNGGSPMPYSFAVDYYSLKPNSSEECQLHLETKLADEQIDEGAATEANVVVVNQSDEAIPTPLAIAGIPGGLEVRHDQLKELVEAGRIAAYEVKGREVVLYWRSLGPEERVELPLSLIAAIPGTYTAPASRAYLYYTDEHKMWVDGLKVEITPRQ
ncbi:MAG: A-macroglobulin complement component [Planctomycetes bacterium]|nr:A-macroglobulin complement component [Planctomycetota bacterium]